MLELREEQLDWLCEQIPDHALSPKGGRPPTGKREAIAGIFWMLDNGAKWKDLPRRFGTKSAVHRWFQHWAQNGVFERLMSAAGSLVEQRGGFRLYEASLMEPSPRPRAVVMALAAPRQAKVSRL
jgi:hypothetical protein